MAQLYGCTIEGNSAARDGGGVAIRGQCSMDSCRVSGNSSRRSGGGLWVRGSLDITGSKVIDNPKGGDCILGGEGGYKGGGAINTCSGNTMGVDDCGCSGQPYYAATPAS